MMEGTGSGGGGGGAVEPVELRQPELLSLIISGEEEATPEESNLGEELCLLNGLDERDRGLRRATRSAGTSYWSISEGPDHPLLSPACGPSTHKTTVQRASRPGLSRIPGRDHRRYYHEYWRSEYLMDFDPQRHGMICMVCGSSLATLKLSTIKRHIRQKHPDSLLWSTADKEVIRSGWESHLSLASEGMYGSAAGAAPQEGAEEEREGEEDEEEEEEEEDEQKLDSAVKASLPARGQEQEPCDVSPASGGAQVLQAEEGEQLQEQELQGPSAQTLEQYLNDSLHAWFRQEFLMEYEAKEGRLLCMVCRDQLPSLHLDHIKSHVLDTHPNSLVYSSEEKHYVLQAWADTHEKPQNSIKSEPNTKDEELDVSVQDTEAIDTGNGLSDPVGRGTLTQDAGVKVEEGETAALLQAPPAPAAPPAAAAATRHPRRRRLRGGDPWRLRLDYLVAYGPQGQGTYCMVCSQVLLESKVSSFRGHIQECHPDTMTLTRQEREAMAAAWTKDYSHESTKTPGEELETLIGSDNARKTTKDNVPVDMKPSKMMRREGGSGSGGRARAKDSGAAASPWRQSHYPGKDQRRNYQVRWRLEYLMDYDCRRHGLICMVCGATLATLKVSTIKRHIQQVHPHSVDYSPEIKQQCLQSYNQKAVHFCHSDDCFYPEDHGHTMVVSTNVVPPAGQLST